MKFRESYWFPVSIWMYNLNILNWGNLYINWKRYFKKNRTKIIDMRAITAKNIFLLLLFVQISSNIRLSCWFCFFAVRLYTKIIHQKLNENCICDGKFVFLSSQSRYFLLCNIGEECNYSIIRWMLYIFIAGVFQPSHNRQNVRCVEKQFFFSVQFGFFL